LVDHRCILFENFQTREHRRLMAHIEFPVDGVSFNYEMRFSSLKSPSAL